MAMVGWGQPLTEKQRARARMLLPAFLIFPFALVALGALVGHLAGFGALGGSFAGVIAAAVIIGVTWILIGGFAAASELRMRKRDG